MRTRPAVLPLLVLLACGPQAEAPSALQAQVPAALEVAFASAAAEFQVPVELLKAIAWVETRVVARAGQRSAAGNVGVMGLPSREGWNLLERSAALTGQSPGALAVDATANVRAAAAALRALGEQSFREDSALSAHQLGDWFSAVSYYPGLESADLAADYATEVFLALERGFSAPQVDGAVLQAPRACEWRQRAPVAARTDALGDYPARAAYVQSPHRTGGHGAYTYVLIHTMQGSYAGTKSWFLNPSSRVSSHYIVRSSDGEVTQMVSHADTAWHAQCYNSKSIGIEHEGFVADPGRWYTDAMYAQSARLTRWIADHHGIPRDRSHIIGHYEVAPACNTGAHSDPGSGWNWSKYMGLVNGTAPTASTGVLLGVVYTGGSTSNPLAGATVSAGGKSATTGADGVYQLTLAPGSYTAQVSKAGFTSAQLTRTVTAGAQVWGSVELNGATASGALKGKVAVFNPGNPADFSAALAGAVATVAGRTLTTGSDGLYSFDLPPGTYTVAVSKGGYQANQVTRTVSAGATTWGSVGLLGTAMADTQAPQLALVFPAAGAQLEQAKVTVTGTASDNAGAVGSVALSVNGGAATAVPVSAGAFSIEVKLRPGANTLTLTAKDAAGNAGSASSTATFHAGVAGAVTVQGDDAARVAFATVELREVASGALVDSATTDASGAYALEVATVPADYLLTVRAKGYLRSSETVTAPDDARLRHDVPLVVGDEPSPTDVALVFSEPLDGAAVLTSTVAVYGSVVGFEVAGVKVNGVQATLLGGGGFAAVVELALGENTLEGLATGTGGETVGKRITVVRRRVAAGQPGAQPMKGGCGCAQSPGGLLLGLLALAARTRRRGR